ncbi:hypothetical protein QJS10_CPA09g00054 [Acorus calamus]|uniref:Uncharacterized protein n=1 Tax=Acorus calamus TaxID=4465 RepID=A0AAV9E7X0_ACOCL|nr:hypothetical protein QJS10_CPA09g00054 [Acorus calamus]
MRTWVIGVWVLKVGLGGWTVGMGLGGERTGWGDLGWYASQDLTALDGSVVRLWDGII